MEEHGVVLARQPRRALRGIGRRQTEVGRRIDRVAERRARDQAPARHRVGARIERDALAVEEARDAFVARALAAVGQADLAPARLDARGAHDDAGLEQALGIEHHVVFVLAQAAEEGADLGAGLRLA